jgi:peptide chain release factor 1
MNPDLMNDMDNYAKLSKEYKDLEKIDFKYEEYEKILSID